MSREHRAAVVERYIAAVGGADIDAIESIFAEGATLEDPVGTEPRVGLPAIIEFYRTLAFPGILSIELTGPPRCPPADVVAFPFRAVFRGVRGEAEVHTYDIINVFELDDAGCVRSMKAYWG